MFGWIASLYWRLRGYRWTECDEGCEGEVPYDQDSPLAVAIEEICLGLQAGECVRQGDYG